MPFQKGNRINVGRHLSKKTKEKIRQKAFGRKASLATRKKISENHLGQKAWNKGLTREDPRVAKYADAQIGKIVSEETRKRMSEAAKGHTAWNKGISDGTSFKPGYTPYNKGKTSKDDPRILSGENHPYWIDDWDKLTYGGKHSRIKRLWKKTDFCEDCGKPDEKAKDGSSKLDWANISGKYLQDRSDWKVLCNSCHFKHDNLIRNLGDFAKKKK